MNCSHITTSIRPKSQFYVRKCSTTIQSHPKKKLNYYEDYWQHIENQKQLIESLGNKIGVKTAEDWYNVSAKQLQEASARYILLKHYRGSLYYALRELYPSITWYPWKFASGVPNGFWQDQQNIDDFIKWVTAEHNILHLDDWYNIDCKEISRLGGAWMLRGRSLPEVVQSVYPNHVWYPWKFRSGIPHGYWNDIKNQKHFLDWISQQLNIKSHEGWYNVTTEQIIQMSGKGLLSLHGISLGAALQAVYPQVDWEPWRFVGGTPKGYWRDDKNVKKFFHRLLDHYGLSENELPLLTYENVRAFGGSPLLRRNGGLEVVLKKYFPHVRLKVVTSKGQLILQKLLSKIFPNQTVELNHKLSFDGFSSPLEIDVYLPQLRLGFEYQGEYHYQWNYLYGSPSVVQTRDSQKKAACDELNITLIDIPFWWDRRLPSLAATIQQHKPGLVSQHLSSNASPLSSQEIPAHILKKINQAKESKRYTLQST